MSLLMDALKKADEAKLTSTIIEESTSPTNWEEQFLPEFKKDFAEIEQAIEDVVINDDNKTPVDWNAEFLSDFKESEEISEPIEKNEELPSSQITPELTTTEVTEPIITSPPAQLEGNITAPQFIVTPAYSDSVTLSFVKKEEVQTTEKPTQEAETPSPQDAQAILAAHIYKKPTRIYGLMLLLSFVLVGLGAGYYYLDQMVTTSVTPIKRRPLLPPPPEQTEQKTTITPNLAVAQPVVTEIKKVISSVVENKEVVTKKEEKPAVVKAEKPKKPKVTPPPKKKPPVKAPAEEYARIQNTPGIHILQKSVASPLLNQKVMKAYTAFQAGDDVVAKKTYQQVLQQDSTNRDALLGLAAIAMRQDQPQQAEQYYQKILKQYPQDTNAQLGLISVLGNKTPEYTESQLKLFIEKNPQSAYGHFNLGNYYASQNQWEKAQQAYFEAYHYDEQQANYAYNLAVSLDQLNQYATASVYYQRTLQLSRRSPNHYFDIHMIQQRLQTLAHQPTTDSALTALSVKSLSQ